jgi:hypothetical protein
MINGLPYLYCVGPVCGAGAVVVLCAMCFGKLTSHGNVNLSLIKIIIAFHGI